MNRITPQLATIMHNKSTCTKLMQRLLFLVILWLNGNAFGQLYNFTHYTMDNGLPQSTIFSVCQDSRYYLWVGTDAGAAMFDGYRFEVYNTTNGLAGNSVRTIFEDSKGNLWFGTDKGVSMYNGLIWKTFGNEQGLQGEVVMKIKQDSLGRIWAATNDAGINILTLQGDSISVKHISQENGLAGNFVLDLVSQNNGTFWAATIGGLSHINYQNDSIWVSPSKKQDYFPSVYISCLDIDKKGHFWIGTLDAGAFCWNPETGETTLLQNSGINDNRIWDIQCEDDESVWIASEKSGLYHVKENKTTQITQRNGLSGNQIYCIYRDRNKNLWFGSVEQGLNLFGGFQLVHYSVNDGLPGNQVLALARNNQGQLWLSTNQQGLVKLSLNGDKPYFQQANKNQMLVNHEITSITFDNTGRMILGTMGEGVVFKEGERVFRLTSTDGLLDNSINCVKSTPQGSVFVGSNMGFNEIKSNKIHSIREDDGLIDPEVQTIISDSKGNIWLGTLGGLARFEFSTQNYRDFNEEEGLNNLWIYALTSDKDDNIWIGTKNGLFRYSPLNDTITEIYHPLFQSKTIHSLAFGKNNILYAGTQKGFMQLTLSADFSEVQKVKCFDKSNGFRWSETNLNALSIDSLGQVWFGTVGGLSVYRPQFDRDCLILPKTLITDVRLEFKPIPEQRKGMSHGEWNKYPHKLKLPYNETHLTFYFTGICHQNPDKVLYRYRLEPKEKEWSPVISNQWVTFPDVKHGEHNFLVISSADGEHWSEPASYTFRIMPPFWLTWWFITLCIVVGIISIAIFVKWREKKLIKEKIYLEQVVKERTAEVVAQKEEIEKQKEEITGSITYAQRIQAALLPGIDILQQHTSDSFVLYKPRDIVSGDYYWIGKNDDTLIVAAADCTGHGVPGAFMSMLGVSFMNKIVNEQHTSSPDKVLGEMRRNVITSLKQGDHAGSSKDGMDMALCFVNLQTLQLTFSGAYNPTIIISNGEANELKADRMPVGYHIVMHDYTPEQVQLKAGDCVYMFSDGFQDQIGGPSERKFMRKNLRELLLRIHNKPFAEQQSILDETLYQWRHQAEKVTEQMDDVLVIGFRV